MLCTVWCKFYIGLDIQVLLFGEPSGSLTIFFRRVDKNWKFTVALGLLTTSWRGRWTTSLGRLTRPTSSLTLFNARRERAAHIARRVGRPTDVVTTSLADFDQTDQFGLVCYVPTTSSVWRVQFISAFYSLHTFAVKLIQQHLMVWWRRRR